MAAPRPLPGRQGAPLLPVPGRMPGIHPRAGSRAWVDRGPDRAGRRPFPGPPGGGEGHACRAHLPPLHRLFLRKRQGPGACPRAAPHRRRRGRRALVPRGPRRQAPVRRIGRPYPPDGQRWRPGGRLPRPRAARIRALAAPHGARLQRRPADDLHLAGAVPFRLRGRDGSRAGVCGGGRVGRGTAAQVRAGGRHRPAREEGVGPSRVRRDPRSVGDNVGHDERVD
ncbi:hypothetical protein DFJ74DRAFT_682522 [Hyaloraphidium curvatum]|nr:hypothetical protein DFJ74DRAFT_682522 [Hyaloraphidium curvatum]